MVTTKKKMSQDEKARLTEAICYIVVFIGTSMTIIGAAVTHNYAIILFGITLTVSALALAARVFVKENFQPISKKPLS